nr:hypothetical protein [Tanacetum cinerariifolium]
MLVESKYLECSTFTHWENHIRGPYENAKLKNTYDPYLDINRIFGRNYGTNNSGNTQDEQGPMEQYLTHDPPVCRVRRFKMIKYSYHADDEYVAVKEHKIFGRNYGTNNSGNTQDEQGPMEQYLTHDPPVCRVRRFKMI